MKNRERESISNRIVHCVKDLPYFTIDNLKILQVKDYHLKIVLSRMIKSGKIIRLKKGMYVLSDFLDKVKIDGNFSYYVEFIGTKICYPSYLSMDYVLYEHNTKFYFCEYKQTLCLQEQIGSIYLSQDKG